VGHVAVFAGVNPEVGDPMAARNEAAISGPGHGRSRSNGSPPGATPEGRRRLWARLLSALTSVLMITTAAVWIGVESSKQPAVVGSDEVDVTPTALNPRDYPGARALLYGAPVPPRPAQPSAQAVVTDFPETSTDGFMSNFQDPTIRVGRYGDQRARRTVALAGGSHAEMWITALNILGKRHGFKVTTYLKMGCPLSTDPNPTVVGKPYPQCFDWNQRVWARIIRDKPDVVVTTTTRPRDNGAGDWTPPDYINVYDKFLRAGIQVVGLRDSPWPKYPDGRTLDTPVCLRNGGNAQSCGTPRARVLSPTDPAAPMAATRPRLHQIDLTRGICTPTFCPAIVGNIIVYKDWHHLSASYIRSLTDELGRRMGPALRWW